MTTTKSDAQTRLLRCYTLGLLTQADAAGQRRRLMYENREALLRLWAIRISQLSVEHELSRYRKGH